MFSKTLVESLLQMSDHPWPEAHKGRPITETWLARRLRSFGVSPRLIRAGETVGRGYELADFQDVVDRYLPIAGIQSVTVLQCLQTKGKTRIPKRYRRRTV